MVADPEPAGIIKSVPAVKFYVPFKKNGTESQFCHPAERIIRQSITIPPSLQFRQNSDRSHNKDRNHITVISCARASVESDKIIPFDQDGTQMMIHWKE